MPGGSSGEAQPDRLPAGQDLVAGAIVPTGPGGGIGRRRGLKPPDPFGGVWVRVPPRAPSRSTGTRQCSTGQDTCARIPDGASDSHPHNRRCGAERGTYSNEASAVGHHGRFRLDHRRRRAGVAGFSQDGFLLPCPGANADPAQLAEDSCDLTNLTPYTAGDWEHTVTYDVPAGGLLIVAGSADQTEVVTGVITVAGGGDLPNTGGNTQAYLLLAFVLFGAAAVFTMGGRKLQRV